MNRIIRNILYAFVSAVFLCACDSSAPQIAKAAATTAVAANATTQVSAVFTAGPLGYTEAAETEIQSASITTTGGAVLINFAAQFQGVSLIAADDGGITFLRVRRDGTLIENYAVAQLKANTAGTQWSVVDSPSLIVLDTPGAGPHEYTIGVEASWKASLSSGGQAVNVGLAVTELKR